MEKITASILDKNGVELAKHVTMTIQTTAKAGLTSTFGLVDFRELKARVGDTCTVNADDGRHGIAYVAEFLGAQLKLKFSSGFH
jgi:hypothetical protein